MADDKVAIESFLSVINMLIKGFEMYRAKVEANAASLKQKLKNSEATNDEKERNINDLKKKNRELDAVNGALNYLNSLADNAKVEIVVNIIRDMVNDPKAKDKGWINQQGKLTQIALEELNKRILEKTLDNQGLAPEEKEKIAKRIQDASEKAVKRSMEKILEVDTKLYQELVRIYQNDNNNNNENENDLSQYFSRENIEAAINKAKNANELKTLNDLLNMKEKFIKGETVMYRGKTVQSNLNPVHEEAEHTQ